MLCTWSSIELPILYRLLFLFLNQIESLQVWGIIRPPYAEQDGSHVLPSRNIHLISCLNFVCWLDWVLASRKAVEKAAQFLQQQRENTWGALLFCWIIPSFLKGKFLLQEIFLPNVYFETTAELRNYVYGICYCSFVGDYRAHFQGQFNIHLAHFHFFLNIQH